MAVRGFTSGDLAVELESLRRSVVSGPRTGAGHRSDPPRDPAAEPDGVTGDVDAPLVALLADLRDEAEAACAEAGEAVHRHPLVLAGAAFLLGLAVGAAARGGRS